ncbi:MAG: SPASM domain-containing protein [Syntrophobacterales bacterium]|jgi:radical SAM protein with 4Fe4S-binding SPASM domain|nr:SPASM domain-containing protein [Syntrophobacterales bacterium]
MSSRSRIALGVILKNFRRLAKHPWIATKLATIQSEKWLFNLLYPQAQTGRANRIRQLSLRITDICNLRCHTCGQWGDQGFLHGRNLRELKQSEVSPDRYLEVFRDLAKHGHHPSMYLWGGEPMLYEGSLELIEAATELRFPTAIATNGTRVAAAAERIVRAPMFLLQLSIDGHNAALHNQARPGLGGADNFADIEAALAAVGEARRAQRSTLPLVASLTTISQANFRHLVDIYETFRDRVDLFVFYLSWWIDEERCTAHEADFTRRFGFKPTLPRGWVGGWRPDDYQELDRQLKTVLARSQALSASAVTIIPSLTGVDNLRAYYTDHSNYFGFSQCISIFQAVEIDSNGDLSPCRDYHDYVVGNIKEATITELWNSPAYQKFRQSLATEGLMPACSRCCGLMGY